MSAPKLPKEEIESAAATALLGTDILPPSKLKDQVHAYAEELCWRSTVGEVLNTYRLCAKAPGELGDAIRGALLMRLQELMKKRSLFYVAEDEDVRRFIRARLKEAKSRDASSGSTDGTPVGGKSK